MAEFPPDCVAFITGGGSGIGLATAQRLVADGVKNLALVDITVDHLKDAISSLITVASEVQLLPIGADCSKEEDVENAIAATVERFGRLDVCFNAAGISGEGAKIVEHKVENFDRVLSINLRGVWLCERAQIRQMMKQDLRPLATGLPFETRGSIVNVGSILSITGLGRASPYVLSKHAVLGLCKSDTIDYAAEGIRTNTVCPGWTQTSMTKHLEDEATAMFIAKTPMGRMAMPEEIAYTVSFMLSDRASFLAGTGVTVDGGYTIH